MTISVLRTVFDKLGGRNLVTDLRTPKRPQRLPEVLDRDTVHRVLAAAQTTRDQLLLFQGRRAGIG
jgi:site-specific recombinase XerC